MFLDEKELTHKLNVAECNGVDRARKTLSFIHKHKASIELDPLKILWHEEEAKRLLDDDKWNLLE